MPRTLIVFRCLAVFGVAVLALIAARGAGGPTKPREVTLLAWVCEAEKFSLLMNDEVDEQLCTTPVEGVPLYLQSERSQKKTRTIETDAAGRAVVGPLRLSGKESFRVSMGCTTHNCMSLTGLYIGDGVIQAGENRLLVFAVPLKGKEIVQPSALSNQTVQHVVHAY